MIVDPNYVAVHHITHGFIKLRHCTVAGKSREKESLLPTPGI
jgi:hypothetical protein